MRKLLTILVACTMALGCGDKVTSKPVEGVCYQTQETEKTLSEDTSTRKLEYVVVHCDATTKNNSWNANDLLKFFKEERGWNRPGYNLWIDSEGRIWTLREGNIDCLVTAAEAVYGVSGYNSRSYHIAYKGGVHDSGAPKDTRTKAQKIALASIIGIIKNACPDVKVVGHTTLNPNKACPSFDATKEYK